MPIRAFLGAGLVLVAAGLLLMHGVSASSEWTALLAGFICAGIGVGMINPSLASTAVGVVPPERSGMGSGINTFRQVGIATGIAGLGAIFQHRVASKVAELSAGTPGAAGGRSDQLAHAVASGQARQVIEAAPASARGAIAHVARESFISGFNEILIVAAALALVGAILGALLVRQQDFLVSPQAAGGAA